MIQLLLKPLFMDSLIQLLLRVPFCKLHHDTAGNDTPFLQGIMIQLILITTFYLDADVTL